MERLIGVYYCIVLDRGDRGTTIYRSILDAIREEWGNLFEASQRRDVQRESVKVKESPRGCKR